MDRTAPSMLKATMIGGLSAGFAGAVPLVGAINACCCALVIGGGFFAAFLYSNECKSRGVEFRPGNGALVGLVAGLFYSLATTVMGGIVQMLMPTDIDQMLEMFDRFDMPPEAVETATRFVEGSTGVIGMILGFFFWLVIAAVFSTIGGLIGGAVFKVEAPPPPTSGIAPPVPPSGGSSEGTPPAQQ
jgi:hypothetical protein